MSPTSSNEVDFDETEKLIRTIHGVTLDHLEERDDPHAVLETSMALQIVMEMLEEAVFDSLHEYGGVV